MSTAEAIEVIPHEQKLYMLWLADGPKPAIEPHPSLSGSEADTARRRLIGLRLICATQGGFWRLTDKGQAWVANQVINRYHTLFPSKTKVDPQRMTLDDIHIEDIAHTLARVGRFHGGMAGFVSVGGHSLEVLEMVKRRHPGMPSRFYLTALLDDGTEYIWNDVLRDLKQTEVYDLYRCEELKLGQLIAKRFDLIYPTPPEIKAIDKEVGDREAAIDRFDPLRVDDFTVTTDAFLLAFYKLRA